jgi:hypothetical protein
MIEIALSTPTQRRPFLPFLPLTVSQRRRRSLDDAATNLTPMPAANAPLDRSTFHAAFVVPISRNQTLALLKSP